jgi:SAM-dependent methyltransferase
MTSDFSANAERFTGFAGLYDQHRAGPPDALAGLLSRYAGITRPELVVDLGSGTGLSTRYWADKAARVVGIEPTPDMRQQAEMATVASNISYQAGYSHDTGLPAGSADLVVCMQSLHWMEPAGTFREAARILRPGGVFAACDYDWPPSVGSAKAEAAFERCCTLGRRFEKELGFAASLHHWDKAQHLVRMQQSACFAYTREIALAHSNSGNGERFVGLLLSQGYVQQSLRHGVSEDALGIPALREVAAATLGSAPRPWHWGACVRVGVVASA